MARRKRGLPSVNSSSMADIAFLMLIFFLVTSSMDTDTGLARRLPPPPQDEENLQEMKVEKRNLLVVLVNKDNQTMVGDTWYNTRKELLGESAKQGLKDKVKEFILNVNNREDWPEMIEEDFGGRIGKVIVSKNHVISLQNDNTTSYKAYITVQNELAKAYNELREEGAKKYYNMSYEELPQEDKGRINDLYPQKISEAEPKNYGEN